MPYGDQSQVAAAVGVAPAAEGSYVYCIAAGGERARLGNIGIGGNEVYAIPYRDICAVAHRCSAQPYRSDDPEMVKAWVLAHLRVVDIAWARWGTVLPFSFGTIVRGEGGSSGERGIGAWLQQEYERLKGRLDRIGGKAEYGVQIFWPPHFVAQGLADTSPEIGKLTEEINGSPRGRAYMLRQRLESLVKRQMEARARECFADFYARVSRHADEVRVEKTGPAEPGWQMLLNLSCLLPRDGCAGLAEELDRIERTEGFRVRFTGPWPPFSFVRDG